MSSTVHIMNDSSTAVHRWVLVANGVKLDNHQLNVHIVLNSIVCDLINGQHFIENTFLH